LRDRLKRGVGALGLAVLIASAGLAAFSLSAPAATSTGTRSAVAARTVALDEQAHLHAASHGGSDIHEEGEASGTFRCKISVDIRIVSINRVSASFTVTTGNSAVSGTGSARFKTQGSYGYLGGVLSITHGSGRFSRASGTDIGISGKFNRETLSATVHVQGSVHY
jgi:hypothetical protein